MDSSKIASTTPPTQRIECDCDEGVPNPHPPKAVSTPNADRGIQLPDFSKKFQQLWSDARSFELKLTFPDNAAIKATQKIIFQKVPQYAAGGAISYHHLRSSLNDGLQDWVWRQLRGPPQKVADQLPQARGLRELFHAAWTANPDYQGKLPEDWRLEERISNRDTGFDATVLKNPEGKYVVAFGPTLITRDEKLDLRDVWTDLKQGAFGVPEQYREAVDLVNRLKEEGKEVAMVTRYSLGGGMASFAALHLAVPATVFNAAGLSPHAIRNVGKENVQDRQHLINNYNVAGDPLSDTDGLLDRETWGGTQLGSVTWMRSPQGLNPLQRHLGTTIDRALESYL